MFIVTVCQEQIIKLTAEKNLLWTTLEVEKKLSQSKSLHVQSGNNIIYKKDNGN